MKRTGLLMLSLIVTAVLGAGIRAEPLRVFVGDFNVVGVSRKDETKAALQAFGFPYKRSCTGREYGGRGRSNGCRHLPCPWQSIHSLDAVARNAGGQTVACSLCRVKVARSHCLSLQVFAEKVSADLLKQMESGRRYREYKKQL
ncbi:MAG: hypothetical protein MZV70_68665 [Desulfobacterales bacterium]|nr:hypothetical protein [Desulfobacterales bacterium]